MFDVLIIGAGPSGMSAAIYLARNNVNVAIVEKNAPGGKMIDTSNIENYPGFTSINGVDLATNMFVQMTNVDVNYISDEVINIKKEVNYKNETTFKVYLKNNTLDTKTIIIATGMGNKKLNIPNEEKFRNNGVSWCAICDGSLYKNKDVAVVGGGNSALKESLYLSKLVNKVYLIHRRNQFRADNILVEKVKQCSNIEIIYNDEVTELIGNKHLEKIKLKSGKQIDVAGLFEYIGFEPNSEVFKHLNILNENGFIIVDEQFQTKQKGIFAIGDIIEKDVRQIATAVGDGANVAMYVLRYI